MKMKLLAFLGEMESLGLTADEAIDEFLADNGLTGREPELVAVLGELHAEGVC